MLRHDGNAIDRERASRRREKASQEIEKSRFPASRRTEHRNELSGVCVERECTEDVTPIGISEVDALNSEHCA